MSLIENTAAQAAARYAVIICTRNRSRLLADCLASLVPEVAAAEVPGRVVVVDNGSTDDTHGVAKAFIDRLPPEIAGDYVFEETPGLSRARNRGIEVSGSAEIIMFLDDDAVVLPGWLLTCLRAFERHPLASGVGGEILPLLAAETGPPPAWFCPPLSFYYCMYKMDGEGVREYPRRQHPIGVNMAFRRSVFDGRRFSEGLGRRGASLLSGEETELCASVRRGGGKLFYVPEMKVRHYVHPDRLTKEWIRERYYYEGISLARMAKGWSGHCVGAGKAVARLLVASIQYPFARSESGRLLCACNIRKGWGYLREMGASMGMGRLG